MIKKKFVLLIMALCALCAAPPAIAGEFQFTEADRAVFLFYKLSNNIPDFSKWISADPKYIAMDKEERPIYMDAETMRLKWGFNMLDAAHTVLRINTNVGAALVQGPNGPSLKIQFPNMPAGQAPYFPYPYGQSAIALVVTDLPKFALIPLNPQQLQNAEKYIPPGKAYNVKLVLRVRATKADDTAPIKMDGIDQWLMMGELGSFAVVVPGVQGQETEIWSYQAPWYLTKEEKALLPLLEGKTP